MMNSYAIVDKAGLVLNTILWDADEQSDYDFGVSEGNKAIKLSENDIVSSGYLYSKGKFSAPAPTDEEIEDQEQLLVARNISSKQSLMDEASQYRDTLQDSVDEGMATEKEIEELSNWKKYRVLLSRIDPNTAEEISWPNRP